MAASTQSLQAQKIEPLKIEPLKGTRVLSLALNLPGPAALMRCQQMGATCTKLEPPAHTAAPAGTTGDPMSMYNRKVYDVMHSGVNVLAADLKTEAGQAALHTELARTDVLITSFRPSALAKLGLGWDALHARYPKLSLVAIVGAPGARGEEPGHDLTYLAEHDLVAGLALPPTLFADMGGSLMACEAVLQARLHQLQAADGKPGGGAYIEVALSEAAGYLALPRSWGLTKPGAGLGGAHAGYRVLPCKDGRVALAALEPHFAAALATAVGLTTTNIMTMFTPEAHQAVAAFMLTQTRAELDALGAAKDIPLCTMAA